MDPDNRAAAQLVATLRQENAARRARASAQDAHYLAMLQASRAQRDAVPDLRGDRGAGFHRRWSPAPEPKKRSAAELRQQRVQMRERLRKRMDRTLLSEPDGVATGTITPSSSASSSEFRGPGRAAALPDFSKGVGTLADRARKLREHQMLREAMLYRGAASSSSPSPTKRHGRATAGTSASTDSTPSPPGALSPSPKRTSAHHRRSASSSSPAQTTFGSPSASASPRHRPRHRKVQSQTWNADLSSLHSRMESVQLDRTSVHLLGADAMDYAVGVYEKPNESLIARTVAYADEIRAAREEEKKAREDAKKYVPRPLLNRLRHFVEDRRHAAHREVLGILSMWLPPWFDVPTHPVISSVAGVATRTAFDEQYAPSSGANVDSPPFYSIIRMDRLNHENQLDELLRRNGRFSCPGNQSLVLPVGRMEHVEEGMTMTLLICKTNPGRSYWMDERDMPGLARNEATVQLPMDPPEDFDSICLLGRKETIGDDGKRRSSLEGVGDPVDPMHEYYRYLVHDSARAIAMWCVTFKPVRRATRERQEKEARKAAEAASAAGSPSAAGDGTFVHRRWQRRVDQIKQGSKQGHLNGLADVVHSARKRLHGGVADNDEEGAYSEPTWDEAPMRSLQAEAALEKFKEACEEKQKVLREKLGKLHERLEEVYDNYALTQHAIHDGLRTTLTDVQMEKDFRSSAVSAWKLQLLQHQLAGARAAQTRARAVEELTAEQLDAYDRLFVPIADQNRIRNAPPGWDHGDPDTPPVQESITVVNVHGLKTQEEREREEREREERLARDLEEARVSEQGQEAVQERRFDRDMEKRSREAEVAKEALYKKLDEGQSEGSLVSDAVAGPRTKTSRRGSMMKSAEASGLIQGSAPNVMVGNKKVRKRRMSQLEIKEVYKNVGKATGVGSGGGLGADERLKVLELEAEAKSRDAAEDIVSSFLEDGASNEDREAVATTAANPINIAVDMGGKDTATTAAQGGASEAAKEDKDSETQRKGDRMTFEERVSMVLPPEVSEREHAIVSAKDSLNIVPVRREGWLLKEGERNTSKKKRWFVLETDALIWRDRLDTSSSTKGTVPLKRIVVRADDTSELDFFLETPDRTYVLSAESPEERHEWIRDLSKNVANVRTLLRRSTGSAGGILALFPRGRDYMELDRLFRGHLELVGHLYSRLDTAKGKSSKIVDAVAPAVFQIFRFRGMMQACSVTSLCLRIEIEGTRTQATLFRRNSLATKLLDAMIATPGGTRLGGANAFLEGAMSPIINAIVANVIASGKSGLEINPSRIGSLDKELAEGPPGMLATVLEQHTDALKEICALCLNQMDAALRKMSPLKCTVLVQLVDDLMYKFASEGGYRGSTSKDALEARVISLLFLRSFCPELTKSNACKLYSASAVEAKDLLRVRRAQTLVAMVLQKMANKMRFKDTSSAYLVPMNTFIDEQQGRLAKMYGLIEARSKELESLDTHSSGAPMIEVAPISDEDAAVVYGDVDIEALASALHTLHGAVYGERVSFSENAAEPFQKLGKVMGNLGRPAERFTKLYGAKAGVV